MRINNINYVNNFKRINNCSFGKIIYERTYSQDRKNKVISSNTALRNEFEAAQKIAKIQDKNKKSENKIYVLSGSSGVGKDTVLRAFLEKHPDTKLSVSYTTRPIREGETDGKDYYFVSKKEFDESVKNGEFIEWGIFSGNCYGTKKQTVKDMINSGNKFLLKLDTVGSLKMKSLFPEAVIIFLQAPSIEEVEQRLRGRHTESEEAIQKRLNMIKIEMENAKQFDYRVVNDTVDNAVSSLEKIIL